MHTWLRQLVLDIQETIWYSFIFVCLALISVSFLLYELIVGDQMASETIRYITWLDMTIAWIFLTDFCIGLVATPAFFRATYWRNNWLNLISSVPISHELTQALRILRIVRAIRVIRVGINFWYAKRRFSDSATTRN